MLFKTIKNTITTLNAVAIFIVCAAVLFFSVLEHEKLYRESVKGNLDGLSENMANDLVSILSFKDSSFEIHSTLLRLDPYEDVKFARVYDSSWKEMETYIGQNNQNISLNIPLNYLNIENIGVEIVKDELIALKLIGDKRLPLGYLLIVHNSKEPLKQSKIKLLKDVLPVTLFFVLLMIIITSFIQQELLIPLTRLSNLAKKIRFTKDYSLRIKINGKKEVSELSRNINNMMATINEETTKNKEHTIQLVEQQNAMEKLANFDSLTGLPNRTFFLDLLRIELAKAKLNNNNVSLIYLDLDGFKNVNDSLGHDTGDQLLYQVGKRIAKCLSEGDILSRLGGDEFLVLINNKVDDNTLIEITEKIIQTVNVPFYINSWEVQIGASIGIAQAIDSGFDVHNFISNADVAMYRSKEAGRNQHTLFVHSMMEENKRKIVIANSITSALKNNEFKIFYQGKVSPNEHLVGYEALIRWNSELLGFVSPAEFIPIAEQSGKILSITKWVIEQTLKDIHTLREIADNEIIVSLNLSAHDIKNYSLIKVIKELYKKYKINPKWIEFEVTESAYLENFDVANKFLTELHNMGSSIALDDFGTGYSSLSYLTKIPLHTLKIDKQFVDNLMISDRSTVITKTIIEMAKQLDLNICAEGVENIEQANLLKEYGCHQMQGYLYYKPTSLEDLLSSNKKL